MTSVTIGNGVTSIGDSAFNGCSGLTTVNWNATNCTSADDYYYYYPIFKGCTNLATVIIGNHVQAIPGCAFKDCSGLTTVNWNATNCTSAGGSDYPIFKGCTNLATVTIGNNVQAIPGYAFQDCSGLTTVYWNATNCTSAGGYYHYPIFKGCTNLATVIIGDNVQTIPRSAFYYCSGLTSVTIGIGVTSIDDYAFYGCSGLTKVYYKGGKSEWDKIIISDYNDRLTNATRYYYSKEEPTSSGNYWHYDDDGVTPTIWKKEN